MYQDDQEGMDVVLFYDQVEEVYCRCCFTIFSPDDVRNEISDEFLANLEEATGDHTSLTEGSKLVCYECVETVEKFSSFKKNFKLRQDQFWIFFGKDEHSNLANIQALSEMQVTHDFVIEEVHENVVFKEEPMEEEVDPTAFVDVGELPVEKIELEIKAENIDDKPIEIPFIVSKEKSNDGFEKCKICGKMVRGWMKAHVRSVHEKVKRHFCDICGYGSYHKAAMVTHVSTHSSERFPCSECNFVTTHPVFLENHVRNVHRDLEIPCTYEGCNVISKNRGSFQDHMRFHKNGSKRIFKCKEPACGQVFSTKHQRALHYQSAHDGAKNECICEQCGATFASPELLKRHIVRHNEKTIPCGGCDAKFACKYERNAHFKRMHSNDFQKVKCDAPHCELMFYSRCSMRSHFESAHLGVRYKCEVPGCDLELSNRTIYINHLKKMHNTLEKSELDKLFEKINFHERRTYALSKDTAAPKIRKKRPRKDPNIVLPKDFICDICGASYSSIANLNRHVVRHGEKTLQCSKCDAKFACKYERNAHEKRHTMSEKTVKCDAPDCDMMFYVHSAMKSHFEYSHLKIRYNCEVEGCNKVCGYKFEYAKHLKEKHARLAKSELEELLQKVGYREKTKMITGILSDKPKKLRKPQVKNSPKNAPKVSRKKKVRSE